MLDNLFAIGFQIVAGLAVAHGAVAQRPGAGQRFGDHHTVVVHRCHHLGL